MINTIKALWYMHKVRKYEFLIKKITKVREKLRNKQANYTNKSELYRAKLKETTTLN